jgi:lysine 6-dehydrogenase
MKKVVVLGAGMVGRAIALDLSHDYEVLATDIDASALDQLKRMGSVPVRQVDLSDAEMLNELVAPFDLVVSAVPGFMGWNTLNTVICAGKNLVDISFLPEDVLPLDVLAKKHGVTAITDCGVAPGIPNILAGYHYKKTKIERFEYMVGGLPRVRTLPFEYKAPFSPCDVIEEYTRPARMVEGGKIVAKPAMSDQELVDFEEVGTLEAFNSDGLRSLLYTLPGIPEMKEKTLRYPGHIDKIKFLRDAGFFDLQTMEVNKKPFVPFEVTSEILKKAWLLSPHEEEFTIMQILFEFEEGATPNRIEYRLFDRYDPVTEISSMARTTGYTCTAAANMVLKGMIQKKGLFPPETALSEEHLVQFLLKYLNDRNVVIKVVN